MSVDEHIITVYKTFDCSFSRSCSANDPFKQVCREKTFDVKYLDTPLCISAFRKSRCDSCLAVRGYNDWPKAFVYIIQAFFYKNCGWRSRYMNDKIPNLKITFPSIQ